MLATRRSAVLHGLAFLLCALVLTWAGYRILPDVRPLVRTLCYCTAAFAFMIGLLLLAYEPLPQEPR